MPLLLNTCDMIDCEYDLQTMIICWVDQMKSQYILYNFKLVLWTQMPLLLNTCDMIDCEYDLQ